MKSDAEIFVNPKFLKFSGKKIFPKDFIFSICKKFKTICKSSQNDQKLMQSIFSKHDNNALFYTGVENNIKEKYTEKINYVINSLNEQFNNKKQNFSLESFIVKTRISKDRNSKGKRLLSLAIKMTKKFDIEQNFNSIMNEKTVLNFFIYPLDYKDFHN